MTILFPPQGLCTVEAIPSDWNNADFKRRFGITITNEASQQFTAVSDYPLLINVTIPALIGHTQQLGQDLRFVAHINGTNVGLKYEIQDFFSLTGKLIVWIKIPIITNGMKIYCYFDNPNAPTGQDAVNVWTDNFKTVNHLNNIGSQLPSNSSGITFAKSDSTVKLVDGKIGKCMDMGNSGGYLNSAISGSQLPKGAEPRTLSFWMHEDVRFDAYHGIVVYGNNVTRGAFGVMHRNEKFLGIGYGGNLVDYDFGSIPAEQWLHVFVIYQSDGSRLAYVNGIFRFGTLPTETAWNTILSDFSLGRQIKDATGERYIGKIDEVRVESVARDPNYIKLRYLNENDPENFTKIGVTEIYPTK